MNEQEFKDKTKRTAIRVIRLVESLPKNATTDVIGKQLLRSATSVGANYRAACRAKSPSDMIAKLAIVEEEADESMYWMELLIDLNLVTSARLTDLQREMNEIVAITVASIKTLRKRKQS
jgi:four helix bundle protein